MTTDNEKIRDISDLIKEEENGTYQNMTDDEISTLIAYHKNNEYLRGVSDGREFATNASVVAYRENNRAQYDTMVKRLQDEENALRGDKQ